MSVLTDTMGVDFSPYLARVLRDVRQHWVELLPESARTKRGKAVLEFFILRDGSVAGLKIAGDSGDLGLDRSAHGSITMSNPFPPLPAEFKGPYLGLRLDFVCDPTVSISPTDVKVPIGESQQFSATLKTTRGGTTLNWTVSGKGCVGESCGTISATGLYRAPATLPDSPRVTVTAALASNLSETGTATVVIAKQDDKPSGESDAVHQKQ
jgi:TonB family protein